MVSKEIQGLLSARDRNRNYLIFNFLLKMLVLLFLKVIVLISSYVLILEKSESVIVVVDNLKLSILTPLLTYLLRFYN